MRVLFATSECVPWVKTGGLADVAGALTATLRREGTDVRVLMPAYRSLASRADKPIAAIEATASLPPATLLEAKVAYENVVRIAQKQRIDPALLSLSYVALAKIYEFYDENSYAVSVYDAAIKIGNVTGGAYNEALASKQRLLKNQ